MNTHALLRTVVRGSIRAGCTCGGWWMESKGADESSLSAVLTGFKHHSGVIA